MNNPDTSFLLEDLEGIEGLDDFDIVDSLKTPEQIAFYLNDVAASGDLDLMKEAMKNVLRANGFAKTVESAGLSREGAYKALRPSSKPQFDTMAKLADSLGLELRFVPKGAHDNSYALAA